MVEQIITYLNAKLSTTGHFHTTYCLVEKKREPREDGDVVYPATYTGEGELEMVEFDAAGFAYFRKDGNITQAVESNEFGQKQLYNVTIPLRLVAMVRRQDIVTDDAYSPDRLARDIATLLTFKNGDLRAGLNANRVLVTAANWQTDPEQIWSDETEGTGRIEPDYSRAFIAMSVTVEVLADEGCIRNACEFDPDILHLFDFCKPSVVARLTDRQVDCLLEALPFPCEPATFTLINTATPPATLDSGSIPSAGSGTIVAPPVTVIAANSLSTQVGPTVTPPSGGSDVIPLPDVTHTDSDGDPVTLPANVPMVCTPLVTIAVTTSNASPNVGETITLTATPSGFVPTQYQFLLFDGGVTVLADQSGNTFNWLVNVAAGSYTVYVLVTDGVNSAFGTVAITVQGLYLMGLYPENSIAEFAMFRVLGVYSGRLLEVRRTVSTVTTAVEIGLDGDYITLDSPVLAVTVGSSAATTLGEFVNAAGYANVDSLSGQQSAFAVRGYRQLNGALAWEQVVAANQPRLVDTGTLETLGGYGCLRYTGNQWQDYGLISGANKPANYSILTVASFDSTVNMGLYGSRPVGSGQTPFSYGHIYKQPSGSNAITLLYGDGTNSRQNTTIAGLITPSAMQLFADFKSSGVLDSDLFVDGIGPAALGTGAGTATDVAGTAVRMLFGRLGDLSGNILTGRQLMFVVYDANKVSDRVGMTSAVNSILGTSW